MVGRRKRRGSEESTPGTNQFRWVGTIIPRPLCQPVSSTPLQTPERPFVLLPHLPVSSLSRQGPELCSRCIGSKPVPARPWTECIAFGRLIYGQSTSLLYRDDGGSSMDRAQASYTEMVVAHFWTEHKPPGAQELCSNWGEDPIQGRRREILTMASDSVASSPPTPQILISHRIFVSLYFKNI